MKLLLVRHGQSEDDLIDAYGGWADFPLTETGQTQLEHTARQIADLDVKFNKILSSPLLRAQQSAEILATRLALPIETFEYVKERNTYGLLCGMKKSDAKEKYPWLVEAYKNDEYVDGSERIEDIKTRAKKAFELLKSREETNLIVVTHGNFLKAFMATVLGKKLVKKEDGGFILLDSSETGAAVVIQHGIEVE